MTLTRSSVPADLLTRLARLCQSDYSGILAPLIAALDTALQQTSDLTLGQNQYEVLKSLVAHFARKHDDTELGKALKELSAALRAAQCVDERECSPLERKVMETLRKLIEDMP